jgi:hypothetical protein
LKALEKAFVEIKRGEGEGTFGTAIWKVISSMRMGRLFENFAVRTTIFDG